MNGGIALQIRFDRVEQLAKTRRIDEGGVDHLLRIGQILLECTLDLREALRVEVVVVEREHSLTDDERATLSPAWKLGDEVGGRRQLHTDIQALFERRDHVKDAAVVRNDLDVDVDRAVAPVEQYGTRSAREIDAAFRVRLVGQSAHELANA